MRVTYLLEPMRPGPAARVATAFSGALLVLFAATQAEGQAPAAVPPPAAGAACAGARELTIGVGAVVHEADAVAETFSLYRYLRKTPPQIAGRCVTVKLVDRPADAEYTISGALRGSLTYRHEEPPFSGLAKTGLIIGLLSGAAGIPLAATVSNDVGKALAITGFALVAASLFGNYLGHVAGAHRYKHEADVALTILRDGKPRATLTFPTKAITAAVERTGVSELSRAELMEPLWSAVAERLAALIREDVTHAAR